MSMKSLDVTTPLSASRQFAVKRLLDLVVTVALLVASWPLFALIALAVTLSSPGHVFFIQERVGRDGRTFGMVKFRSMYVDAEARRNEIATLSDREGLCLKLRHDPRVTPVGRVLRRWSLDELPQLFNVLAGDMSLVGPRPALVEEVAAYPARAHQRHQVLPGITGYWQVAGRAEIGFEDMIEMDLAYVREVSVMTDLVVLCRTIGAVVTGKGAY